MNNFRLNLPTDIPWKRLAFSEDMIVPRSERLRWKSSLAAFYFEPEQGDQPFDDVILTYVKITCTITNFVPPNKRELSKIPFRAGWEISNPFDNLDEFKSFPAYGAILQVLVKPLIANSPISTFPYIMDMEPKKREIYETASESGAVLSRSISSLNISKGGTSAKSHEVLDIDRGFQVSGSQKIGPIEQSGSLGISKESGTKDLNQNQLTSVRTTDSSTEKREDYAFSTNLTHMYHELMSYHLGTNRCVFFMLPRPNTKTSDATFINGPIQLQGIQEFLLIINRPVNQPGFCIEATLETAHIVLEELNEDIQKDRRDEQVTHRNEAIAQDMEDRLGDSNRYIQQETKTEILFDAPDGWIIDLSQGNGSDYSGDTKGYTIINEDKVRFTSAQISISKKQLSISSTVYWEFWEEGLGSANKFGNGYFSLTLKIYLVEDKPAILNRKVNKFYLTGRKIQSCTIEPPQQPQISVSEWLGGEFEFTNAKNLNNIFANTPFATGRASSEMIFNINKQISLIGNALIDSIDSVHRYPIGVVSFYDSDIFVNQFALRISDKDNVTLEGLKQKRPDINNKTISLLRKAYAPNATIKDILATPLNEFSVKLKITEESAVKTRSELMGYTNAMRSHF